MNKDKAQELVKNWLSSLSENDAILFETEDDGQTIKIKQHKRHGLMVGRSEELTEQLKTIRSMVQARYEEAGDSGAGRCPVEGIAYFIYQRDSSQSSGEKAIIPLYVGIARSIGKKKKLSALFKAGGWLRFADTFGSNGHIGKINDCLSGKNGDYQIWVDALFHEKPELQSSITLKHPTYVKVETWTKESASIVPKLEHTHLAVEEMLRIWALNSAGRGESLVNRDGNNY